MDWRSCDAVATAARTNPSIVVDTPELTLCSVCVACGHLASPTPVTHHGLATPPGAPQGSSTSTSDMIFRKSDSRSRWSGGWGSHLKVFCCTLHGKDIRWEELLATPSDARWACLLILFPNARRATLLEVLDLSELH